MSDDLLDMLFDDPAPTKPVAKIEKPLPPGLSVAKGRAPADLQLNVRQDRRAPTPRDHRCDHPGCKAWGAYGYVARGSSLETIERSYWWCREHLPEWWFG